MLCCHTPSMPPWGFWKFEEYLNHVSSTQVRMVRCFLRVPQAPGVQAIRFMSVYARSLL